MTPQLVTDFVKRKKLPWVLTSTALLSVFAYLTFGSSLLTLFLRELGFDRHRIGFILSLFPFCGLVALVAAPWAERMGTKRIYLIFYGARKFILMLLLFVPFILESYGIDTSFRFVTIVILTFAMARAIAETASLPWSQEYIPRSTRGRFSALNFAISGITGLLSLAAAGYVLKTFTGLPRYVWLMAAGCLLGFVGVLCMLPVPGGAPVRRTKENSHHARNLIDALRDRDLRQFMLGTACSTLGVVMLQSFAPLFMTEQVGLSVSQAVILDGGMLMGGLLIARAWGWAADRFGSKPVLVTCISIVTAIPIIWTFLPRHSVWSFPIALATSLLFGIGFWGAAVGHSTLLYNRIVPNDKRTPYMAIYYAWAGITAGISPLLAGTILEQMQPFSADPYIPLFMISLAMLFLSINLYSRISMQGESGTREFISMLFQANPLQVVRNILTHSSSKDEAQRLAVTQRIGEVGSALNESELRMALADPSFNVRFEAVVAAARMTPTPTLINALIGILKRYDAELSTTAAWALGRLNAVEAIPTLREGLGAPFPSLRQRCMRSLGMLNDTPSIPRLRMVVVEALQQADSPARRLDGHAALCALGSLKARECIPDVLTFIQTRSADNDVGIHELTLSLALMLNLEAPYIRLWRNTQRDTGGTLAESVEEVEKRWRILGEHHNALLLDLQECIDHFAREDVVTGLSRLAERLQHWPDVLPDRASASVVATCGALIASQGPPRLDCAVLALVLLGSKSGTPATGTTAA